MCIRDREYWAAKKGQLALDKENAAREAAGQPTKPTKFETDKAKLRRTIDVYKRQSLRSEQGVGVFPCGRQRRHTDGQIA